MLVGKAAATFGSRLQQDGGQQHLLQAAAAAHHLHVSGLEHLIDGFVHMAHLHLACTWPNLTRDQCCAWSQVPLPLNVPAGLYHPWEMAAYTGL